MRTFCLLYFICLCHGMSGQQTAIERSVLLEASWQENPASITLHWQADAQAPDYTIYRKEPGASQWGAAKAFLDGSATEWTDTDVVKGVAYEYGVFKHGFDLIRDTVWVEAGRLLRFEISDMYGIGLCCNFGIGYFELESCGALQYSGSDFGWVDTHTFEVCQGGTTEKAVVVTIKPDIFPNSTSWRLLDATTNEELGSSGFVGQHLAPRPAYGYIIAGQEVPSLHESASILLLVEEGVYPSLEDRLIRLREDLYREGWRVHIQTAAADQSVTTVKEQIRQLRSSDPNLSSVFIIGHIPVPYSGDMYPDTHLEHKGAWAADTYYGDLTGSWTDTSANIVSAQFTYNHNVPGDGRFDQVIIPGRMDLQVGRVDFFDMPAFAESEAELLVRYLDKNHLFRTGQIQAERRALVDDNFGPAFAAPAASGWRNFAPMFGIDSVQALDYFSTMRSASYLWSYGCGSGSHISAAGVGTTQDFATDSLLSVFTMLFGSQFGDWDNVNNFLRAPLASGLTLTNCWAGNPPYTFHQMAMGASIGECVQQTQNSDNGVYLDSRQLVHTALMGDPSLRMHPFVWEATVEGQQATDRIQLSWADDPTMHAYQVFRLSGPDLDQFEAIGAATQGSFIDEEPIAGMNYYMVRPIKLESSASGTYLNPGRGVVDSVFFDPTLNTLNLQPEDPFDLYPNPARDQVYIQWSDAPKTPVHLTIYDTQGQIISRSILLPADSKQLDISNLTNGIYTIRISDGKEQEWTKKLVIVR